MNNFKNFLLKNKNTIIIIIIFIILPLIFFKDHIRDFSKIIYGDGDPNYNTLPLRQLFLDSIKNFEMPFWNRYIYSGYPLLANPQAFIFYPVALVFDLIFPLTVAYNLSIIFHYSLAGIFFYLFLKEYELDDLSSFTGGLIFMFSGVMISHRGHAQMLYTIIWFPLILYFLEKFRKTRRFEFVFIASIFYCISYFAGSMQLFLYGSIITIFYILYHSLMYGRKNLFFLLSFLVFIFGILLTAIQTIPTFELTKLSSRGVMDYGYFTSFSFDIRQIPTLIFPFLFGQGTSGLPYFGPWTFGETIAYFGISTIPLVIMGIFIKDKKKYLWIFILIFSFLLVLGSNTFFYKLMYQIPLYNKFRVPARNWFEFGFAFSVLASLGFYKLREIGEKKIKIAKIISVALLTIILIIFLGFYYFVVLKSNSGLILKLGMDSKQAELFFKSMQLKNKSIYVPLILLAITIIVILVSIFKKYKAISYIIIVFIFIDLMSVGLYGEGFSSNKYLLNKNLANAGILSLFDEHKQYFRVYPYVNWGDDYKIYPNINIHYGVDTISGYDPLFLQDYNYITGLGTVQLQEDVEALLKNNNILSVTNTKYIVYFSPKDIGYFLDKINKSTTNKGIGNNKIISKADNYVVVYDNEVVILENLNFLPRFYLVENIIKVSNIEQSKKILWDESTAVGNENFNSSSDATVENVKFDKLHFDNNNSKIITNSYKNNSLALNYDSETDGFLIFSDTYYPGWHAYIDGKETEIYKTNGIFKGIYISKGKHDILFKFVPKNFYIGVFISFTCFFTIIILAFYLFKKNYRKNKNITNS